MRVSFHTWIRRIALGAALGLCATQPLPAWSDEKDSTESLQKELDGDKAFLIEWLAQPDDDTRLDAMHEDPEIQAIAERMPRAQARLRELQGKSGTTATDENP
jgi:hypothetical protein